MFTQILVVLTIFSQNIPILDNSPLLKVKNMGKFFHNIFVGRGKCRFFWQNIHLCLPNYDINIYDKAVIIEAPTYLQVIMTNIKINFSSSSFIFIIFNEFFSFFMLYFTRVTFCDTLQQKEFSSWHHSQKAYQL